MKLRRSSTKSKRQIMTVSMLHHLSTKLPLALHHALYSLAGRLHCDIQIAIDSCCLLPSFKPCQLHQILVCRRSDSVTAIGTFHDRPDGNKDARRNFTSTTFEALAYQSATLSLPSFLAFRAGTPLIRSQSHSTVSSCAGHASCHG